MEHRRGSRGINRREFLAGALGLAVTSEALASSEHTAELAERRRQVFERLQRLWQEPQPDCEGKSPAVMLRDIETTLGEWAAVFKHVNHVGQVEQLMTRLGRVAETDPVWSATNGPAAQLEELHDRYWNPATFVAERQTARPLRLERPELLGFADDTAAEEFFSDGEFVPRGWLQPVQALIPVDKPMRSPFTGTRHIEGKSVHTPATLMAKAAERVIHLRAETDSIDPRYSLKEQVPFLYHEIAHANDWDTGHYPADLKIKTYWKVLQRLQTEKHSGTSLLTRVHNHERASHYERWRAGMEYWAEIATQYCANEQLADEDFAIVDAVVRTGDPSFDRAATHAKVEQRVAKLP